MTNPQASQIADGRTEPVLLDVPVQSFWSSIATIRLFLSMVLGTAAISILAMPIGAGIALLLEALIPAPAARILGYATSLLVAYFILLGFRRHGASRAARWLTSQRGAPLELIHAEISNKANAAARLVWPNPGVLARWLANVHPGRVIRFVPTPLAFPIEPLTVPIEPLLLSHGDAGIRELAPHATALGSRPSTGRTSSDMSPFISLEFLLLMMMFSFVTQTSGLLNSWPFISACALSAIIPMTFILLRHALSGEGQWLIVNGAIVVRTRRGLARLSRASSGLVVRLHNPLQGTLYLSDGFKTRHWQVSAATAEAALRAWLSPLPPPDLDKLSDLK